VERTPALPDLLDARGLPGLNRSIGDGASVEREMVEETVSPGCSRFGCRNRKRSYPGVKARGLRSSATVRLYAPPGKRVGSQWRGGTGPTSGRTYTMRAQSTVSTLYHIERAGVSSGGSYSLPTRERHPEQLACLCCIGGNTSATPTTIVHPCPNTHTFLPCAVPTVKRCCGDPQPNIPLCRILGIGYVGLTVL
jgi:hypothetical protein